MRASPTSASIARVARQHSEKPLLGLGAQFGPQLALEGVLGAGQALVDPELGIGGGGGTAAGLLQ